MGSARDGQMIGLASKIMVSDGKAQWRMAPAWLAFFLGLGEAVALEHQREHRVAVIVVPPVRSFAAAAAATAAVIAVACRDGAVPNVDEHFRALAQLSIDTPVVVKIGQKIYSGKFAGIVRNKNEPLVQVEYNGMTHYIPKYLCQRIRVGSGGKKSLPKASQRSAGPEAAAVAAIVGQEAAVQFLGVPTVDVVLVGHVALLSQELTAVSARPVSQEGHGAGVTLAGLFRAARFLPEGGISRSMLLSDRVAEFEMPVSDTPHVAVFDGARAFTRYRTVFTRSSWVVILDRCSAGLMEGADVANTEFATRKGESDLMSKLTVPAGTETQAFERR